MASKLVIEIGKDGSLKTNATEMVGTEKELLADLGDLAKAVGGNLEVEKHVESIHHHSHGDTSHHHKIGGK